LLLKVGVIMMSLALALVIAAVVVRVTVGSEPGRMAAEVARKTLREAPGNSSGKQEESLKYDSPSPPDEPVRRRKEGAREPGAAAVEPESSNSRFEMPQPASQQTPSEPELQPQQHQTQPQETPLPAAEGTNWDEPTQGELERANQERHYELLPGAIMGLTIEAIAIYDAPVFDSKSQWALAKGSPTTHRPPCHGHLLLRGTSSWRDIAWAIGEPGAA
jgi:hypothetical protein